jgi:DNA replicative helicase MCM subunit Mcm2 (Cdc46/Mcm family)
VALTIELDDVNDFDSGLAEAIANNTRRYVSIASEVIHEILPDYKEREVGLASSSARRALLVNCWPVHVTDFVAILELDCNIVSCCRA